MKRSWSWAVIASYPLLAMGAVYVLADTMDGLAADGSEVGILVAKYWFGPIVLSCLCHMVFFTVHMWKQQGVQRWARPLWIGTMWLFGPIFVPLYWWLHAESV